MPTRTADRGRRRPPARPRTASTMPRPPAPRASPHPSIALGESRNAPSCHRRACGRHSRPPPQIALTQTSPKARKRARKILGVPDANRPPVELTMSQKTAPSVCGRSPSGAGDFGTAGAGPATRTGDGQTPGPAPPIGIGKAKVAQAPHDSADKRVEVIAKVHGREVPQIRARHPCAPCQSIRFGPALPAAVRAFGFSVRSARGYAPPVPPAAPDRGQSRRFSDGRLPDSCPAAASASGSALEKGGSRQVKIVIGGLGRGRRRHARSSFAMAMAAGSVRMPPRRSSLPAAAKERQPAHIC